MLARGWQHLVDTRSLAEQQRLSLLEEVFDPFTISNLERIGLHRGSRCLEVGAGAGSIAHYLAGRVGSRSVVATDLSTDFLGPLAEQGVDVRRHDVTVDPAPGTFDLIHARFVLDHLPGREQALARMASWLRPGGWLLIESGNPLPELVADAAAREAVAALCQVMGERVGTDTRWARTLPLPLRDAGLHNCDAEAQVLPALGGSPLARWMCSTVRLAEDQAVAGGYITPETLAAAYTRWHTATDIVDHVWMTVAAWGQRRS